MKIRNIQVALSGLLVVLLFTSCGTSPAAAQRKATWAQPVESKHIENFYKVDKNVYRSSQPSAEAFKELEQLGIKEVLSLRNFHNDKDKAKGTGLKLNRVAMSASSSEWDKLVEAVRIIKNSKGPIVVHCWHGSDRTGLVVALYRLVFQNWTKEEVVDELEHGGYGYHTVYGNIKTFIRNVNVEEFREEVMR